MKALNMTKGEVIKSNSVIYLYGEIPVTSHSDGIFYSMVECGQTVSTGALLGYSTDYFGKRIEEFSSPVSGIVLMSYDTPVINKGEEPFYISETKVSFK